VRFHPGAQEETGAAVSDLFHLSLDIHDEYKKAKELITLAA